MAAAAGQAPALLLAANEKRSPVQTLQVPASFTHDVHITAPESGRVQEFMQL